MNQFLFIVNEFQSHYEGQQEYLGDMVMTGVFSSLGRAQDAAEAWHRQGRPESGALVWHHDEFDSSYCADPNDGLCFHISVCGLDDMQDM